MTPETWQRFCVVGLGGHARTKLIPAIESNGQQLAGVVTSAVSSPVPAPAFTTVERAIAALPGDTVFVIASPPGAHASQALAALAAGRDVVVEKPAFVATAEAEAASEAADRTGAILVEGFMNRFTHTHRRFVEAWEGDRPTAVEFAFTIPEAPAGTFRHDEAIGSSNLYDIGSYWLAALLDAGAPIEAIELEGVDHAGLPGRERLHLAGNVDGVAVRALVGVDAGYANVLTLVRPDGSRLAFEPFVYGRPGPRRITRTSAAGTASVEQIEDVNAFAAMFAIPRREWLAGQPARLRRMVELTRQLERLGRSLAAFRAAAA